MTIALHLDAVTKAYPEHPELLRGITLDVLQGQTVALLGRSGSGKTTLLRIIAGLESADSGRVFLGGSDISGIPVENRNIGYMFQGFALFPHLNVEQNIAFGLEVRRVKKNDVKARVRELLSMVDLEGFEKRSVHQLSAGQKQRVAFARALAPAPRLLLLDEPMSALDEELKLQLLSDLRSLIERTSLTSIYVTHDQKEAAVIASTIVRLESGQILSTISS